jgi:quinol monooxygenase YgiN
VIIHAGWIHVDAADRDAYVASRHEQVRAARDEPGCLEYAITADSVDPAMVQVFEAYEDEEALAEHVKTLRPQTGFKVHSVNVFRYDLPLSARRALPIPTPQAD